MQLQFSELCCLFTYLGECFPLVHSKKYDTIQLLKGMNGKHCQLLKGLTVLGVFRVLSHLVVRKSPRAGAGISTAMAEGTKVRRGRTLDTHHGHRGGVTGPAWPHLLLCDLRARCEYVEGI